MSKKKYKSSMDAGNYDPEIDGAYYTPFKYRYTLNPREVERTDVGNFIVYHHGKRMEINTLEVEFGIPGNEDMLTKEQFYKIIEGTKGIKKIYGEFKDEFKWMDYEEWKALKKWYKDIENSHWPDWLKEFCRDKKNEELLSKCAIEDLGNGIYRIGDMYTGRKGLEEFDKVMKKKAKEYVLEKEEEK
jgi:hypothetical protein